MTAKPQAATPPTATPEYPHGVDADGHCVRCGIAEENPVTHECPAAFAAAPTTPPPTATLGELLDKLSYEAGEMDKRHEEDCDAWDDDYHKPCKCGANAGYLAARKAVEECVEQVKVEHCEIIENVATQCGQLHADNQKGGSK